MKLRLSFLLKVGLLATGSAACGPTGDGAREPVRSLVLVSIDTLRADRLGLYGYGRGTSPFLDGLAASGVVFDAAISQSPWTLPSHGALLASRHPSSLGAGPWERPDRIPQEAVTIAEVLDARGMRTRAFVNGGFLSAGFGLDQGFERWSSIEPGSDTFATAVTRALRWIDKSLVANERFFLFLHTYDVHEYQPPPETSELLVRPYLGFLGQFTSPIKMVAQDRGLDESGLIPAIEPRDLAYLSDLYDATILAVDRQLEHFWRGLEERGLAQETLLVITSDHGEEFLEHGGTGHGYTLYDENVRVPLVLVHPSLAPGRVGSQVRSIDLAPTVVELLGFEAPSAWQGSSLFSGDGTDRPAFSEQAHVPFVGLRSGGFKLIRGAEGFQLYDLGADPLERVDLAGTGHPKEAELARALEAWIAAHGAWPPPEPAEPDGLTEELLEELRRLGYLGDG